MGGDDAAGRAALGDRVHRRRRVLGTTGFHGIDHRNRHCGWGIWIGPPSAGATATAPRRACSASSTPSVTSPWRRCGCTCTGQRPRPAQLREGGVRQRGRPPPPLLERRRAHRRRDDGGVPRQPAVREPHRPHPLASLGVKERLTTSLPVRAVGRFLSAQGPNWATIIAWNLFFAFFPMVFLVITVVGLALHDPGTRATIEQQVLAAFPSCRAQQSGGGSCQIITALDDFRQEHRPVRGHRHPRPGVVRAPASSAPSRTASTASTRASRATSCARS